MSFPVFPPLDGLAWPVHKRPTFATLISTAVSGREVRSPQMAFPLWEFELKYEILREQGQNINPTPGVLAQHEMMSIAQLYVAVNGQFGTFYYSDPSDHSRLRQRLGIGDGTTKTFTAARDWGRAGLAVSEPVGGIARLLNVHFDDDLYTGPPYYNFSGNQITFNTAPADNVVVDIDFDFYYLCRFTEDIQDFENFMQGRWALQSLKFRSVKP